MNSQTAAEDVREILACVTGEAQFEGTWYGEKHPTRKGAYWWRSILRERVEKLLEANERLQAELSQTISDRTDCAAKQANALVALAAAHADLRNLRAGETCTVEYNLSPAMVDGAIRDKLIELGWTPPDRQPARAEGDKL